MKKMIVSVSIGIAILFVLVSFSTIASAQTTKLNEIRSNIFQQIKDRFENRKTTTNDFPFFLQLILAFLIDNFIAPLIYLFFAILGSFDKQ